MALKVLSQPEVHQERLLALPNMALRAAHGKQRDATLNGDDCHTQERETLRAAHAMPWRTLKRDDDNKYWSEGEIS
ncbi:hypothetical protein Tco_0909982 [Tanacetum coccineum]|uniref:Uncharacterized protein n=1 Tax=Tanacetum coccineum TaxID=301880 RepID=A0ABQ5CTG2_9ASTR